MFDGSRSFIDNLKWYGDLVGVSGANGFGNFDSEEMRDALSQSEAFKEDPSIGPRHMI